MYKAASARPAKVQPVPEVSYKENCNGVFSQQLGNLCHWYLWYIHYHHGWAIIYQRKIITLLQAAHIYVSEVPLFFLSAFLPNFPGHGNNPILNKLKSPSVVLTCFCHVRWLNISLKPLGVRKKESQLWAHATVWNCKPGDSDMRAQGPIVLSPLWVGHLSRPLQWEDIWAYIGICFAFLSRSLFNKIVELINTG